MIKSCNNSSDLWTTKHSYKISKAILLETYHLKKFQLDEDFNWHILLQILA